MRVHDLVCPDLCGPASGTLNVPGEDAWTLVDVTVSGYNPPVQLLDAWLLSPDVDQSVMGRLP
jgi:hypothetical protein